MTLVPPKSDDTVAWVTVRYHANGTLSVAGTIGDKHMVHQMLDHAKDAITRQIQDQKAVIIPNRDVEVIPTVGLREMGDLRPEERGDA